MYEREAFVAACHDLTAHPADLYCQLTVHDFRFYKRFVDDGLAIEVFARPVPDAALRLPNVIQHVLTFYPACLTIKTTGLGRSLDFMDITISQYSAGGSKSSGLITN